VIGKTKKYNDIFMFF